MAKKREKRREGERHTERKKEKKIVLVRETKLGLIVIKERGKFSGE